jgi:hypothetical protein
MTHLGGSSSPQSLIHDTSAWRLNDACHQLDSDQGGSGCPRTFALGSRTTVDHRRTAKEELSRILITTALILAPHLQHEATTSTTISPSPCPLEKGGNISTLFRFETLSLLMRYTTRPPPPIFGPNLQITMGFMTIVACHALQAS